MWKVRYSNKKLFAHNSNVNEKKLRRHIDNKRSVKANLVKNEKYFYQKTKRSSFF